MVSCELCVIRLVCQVCKVAISDESNQVSLFRALTPLGLVFVSRQWLLTFPFHSPFGLRERIVPRRSTSFLLQVKGSRLSWLFLTRLTGRYFSCYIFLLFLAQVVVYPVYFIQVLNRSTIPNAAIYSVSVYIFFFPAQKAVLKDPNSPVRHQENSFHCLQSSWYESSN